MASDPPRFENFMKLALILLLISFLMGYSQNYVGLEAGLNLSDITADPEPPGEVKTEFLMGFGMNGFFELGINNLLSVNLGMGYGSRGHIYLADSSMFPEEGLSSSEEVRDIYRFHTIQAPLLLGLKFPLGKGNLFLNAGPGFGFIVSSEVEINVKDSSGTALINNGSGMTFKRFSMEALGKIGHETKTGPGKFVIAMGYGMGLINVIEEMDGATNDPSFKLNNLKITLGYKIGLNGQRVRKGRY